MAANKYNTASGATSITDGAVTGTLLEAGSYGQQTVAGTEVQYDLRQVRYLPAAAAASARAAGAGLDSAYGAAISAYGTAKGNWDNYVALLAANAKQDAFAAMFSPPKAPTVPPLPSFPWAPAAYAGPVALSVAA